MVGYLKTNHLHVHTLTIHNYIMIVVTLQLKYLNAMKCSFLLDRAEVIFKYSSWKWKTTDDFNLNMSFVFFHLKYSGEACLQERVIINSTRHGNIGRYSGRRH